ncbi:NAD(+) synthetase [Candidatus Woesearchaeota archaeon]|nr:MAG: NAD(+) synthetase [Candidatus Woesearchaeota archaeon]
MEMKAIENKIINWVKEQVNQAGCKGVVVGLSGGVDSSVVGVLCKKAFPNNTLGLLMPCFSHGDDLKHAKLVAEKFDIQHKVIELAPVFKAMFKALEGREFSEADIGIAVANIKPRLRMVALYYYANKLNYLVVGTDNKSEAYSGYFTKYGDGGVDILPIADLLKREVRQLARHLGIPDVIIEKSPSAGLWHGQTDEGELGITYDELDAAIEAIESGDTSSVDPKVLERVTQLYKSSEHKRRMPPMCLIKDG